MCVLDALPASVPGLITDDLHAVVAQNPLNVALLWRWCTDTGLRSRYAPHQREMLGRVYVADLRVTSGAWGDGSQVRELVRHLADASEVFRGFWSLQEVAARRTMRKVLLHPKVGRLELHCDVVVSPPSGQRPVLFRPQPGSGTARGPLIESPCLRVLGVQVFEPGG
jgi:hypothetical protein